MVMDVAATAARMRTDAGSLSHAYRPDIDGLRSVAVVPVVLFHAGLPWISGGYVGVDVFFVISGYLITSILAREIAGGRFSVLGFYERRARRILPALFAVLAASFLAGWVLLLPADFADFAKSAAATIGFLSNVWFSHAAADYFAPGAELSPLLHTWSLAVEEQFYIFFPLLLWALLPRGRRLTLGICLALSLASLALATRQVTYQPNAAFYLSPARAWELGLGALLALGLQPDLSRPWLREIVAAAGLAAIVIAVFAYDAATPFPGLAALPPCLGAAALIAAGAQGPSLAGRALSQRGMVAIGLISYSLYLWHWPIMVFARHYLGGAALPADMAWAAVAASLALGWFSWAVIERPFRRRPPEGPSRRVIFAASGAGMAGFGAAAMAVYLAHGVPGRFGPEVQAVLAAARDRNPARAACFDRDPDQGLCRFGAAAPDMAAADILLWGDSHADALMPGLELAARQAGQVGVFAGRNACAPLLGVDRIDLTRAPVCSDFNDAVMAMLRARDDIGTVVLAARWALVAEGVRTGDEEMPPALLGAGRRAAARPEENFAIFEDALRRSVAEIRATGRAVVLTGGVPEIGWHVPRRWAATALWGHPVPAAPDAAASARREARVTRLFDALAAADPGVRALPLAPLLCDPDCRTAIDGRPIYVDGNHINRFGAETLLAPAFSGLFP